MTLGNEKGPIRIAVIGTGKIARTRFLPALARVADAKVSAVATRNPGRLDRQALGLDENCAVLTMDDLLMAGRRLADAVYIALPNDLHVSWVQRAAGAGLHVLCEKPLADVQAEAIACAAACAEAGVLLAEGFMYRQDPRYSRAKDLIESGAIGALRIIEATFGYRLEDLDNVRLRRERKGGAIRDVGCYGLDVIRLLSSGEVADVRALCTLGERSGVDEIAAAILQLDNGALGVVQASTHLARQQRCRICGSKGNILLPNAFNPPPDQPRRLVLEPEHGDQVVETFPPFDPFEAEIACFVDSINAGRLLHPLENGVASSAVLESVVKAMTSGVVSDLIGSG